MPVREALINKYINKAKVGDIISINELRERFYNGEKLKTDEMIALQNFDSFRIQELNKEKDDLSFHERYRELQVLANLGEHREFLKDIYFCDE